MKRTGAGRHARGSACCTLVTDGNRPSLDHRMTSLPRYQDTKDQRPMKTSPSPRANYTTTPQVDPTIDFFPFPSPLSFFYLLSLSLSPFPERSHSRIPTPTRLVSRPLTAVVFTIIKRVCLRARFLSPRRALRQQVEGRKAARISRRDYVASAIFYLLPVASTYEGYDYSRGCALE